MNFAASFRGLFKPRAETARRGALDTLAFPQARTIAATRDPHNLPEEFTALALQPFNEREIISAAALTVPRWHAGCARSSTWLPAPASGHGGVKLANRAKDLAANASSPEARAAASQVLEVLGP